jgi:hypothetical protein
MSRFEIVGLTGALLFAFTPAAVGQVPPPVEVRLLVQMPLATNAVLEVGVPAPRVERTVVLLNQHHVPVVESVEIIRYAPFPLVVERYQVTAPPVLEPRWDVATLDMPILLETHIRAGLTGAPLAAAVLVDLRDLGFAVAAPREAVVSLPPPWHPDFVVFLQPGFRFETRQGLFHDQVIVVEERHFPRRERPGPPPHARAWGWRGEVPPPHARAWGRRGDVPPPHARGESRPQAEPPPRGKGPPDATPSPPRGKGPPHATPPSKGKRPPQASPPAKGKGPPAARQAPSGGGRQPDVGPPQARGKGPPAKAPPGRAGGQERRGGPPGHSRGQGPGARGPGQQGKGKGPDGASQGHWS